MGLVDFAIDMAAVLGASRNIAFKHVALRSRQLDRYGRTSSLISAVSGLRVRQGTRATPPESAAMAAANSSRDGVGASEIPLAAGDEKLQNMSSSRAAESQSARDPANEQPERGRGGGFASESFSPSSILRGTKPLSGEALRADHSFGSLPSDGTKSQYKIEEPIPEGVNLDLFRTSRGSRLNPLWKRGDQRRPEYDLGVFRTVPGSKIPSELNASAEAVKVAASVEGVPKTIQPVEENKSTRPAEQDLPDPKIDHVSLVYESQRETEEVEVPRYPDPSGEVLDVKSPASHPKAEEVQIPVAKDDAVELGEMLGAAATPKYELRESKVPSSRLGRVWSYGGLAAGMLTGAVSEFSSRAIGGGGQGSVMFSPANMERLVAKLSTMRGAALKLGQMMSFQDEKMLPAPIQEVLQRVQDRADYMPAWQRDRVLITNLGVEWRELFQDFEEKPIAAASIGQVHRAVLKSNGARVAVKIQYPGVADSINSDLNNLRMLLAASKLLPKGLYLDKTIDNARTELSWECDYEREAQCAFRYKDLLAGEDDVFRVPHIYVEASGKQVLTMEFMDGVGVTRIDSFTQAQRDWIGTQILRLCLREITEFHFMQTDPNWTNFLYDAARDRLVLLDFGASREYPTRFITLYVQLLAAAARTDRAAVKALSEELGYLTGHESRTMLDAHIASVLTLAEPFLESAPEVYDFRDQTITERVKAQIPVMIRERLAPPPEETYSLHRKLSGAFLLCARLGSRVKCRDMFESAVAKSEVLKMKI